MNALYWCGAVLLIVLIWPWLRCGGKRIVMAVRLARAARKNGWTRIPARPLWFFASNLGARPDIYFEKRTEAVRRIYAVKLWASLYRMQNAYFVGPDPGKVRYRRVIPLAGRFATKFDWGLEELTEGTGGGINLIRETRDKPRPDIDYWTAADGGTLSGVIPVLLFCPAPLNVGEAKVVPLTHTTVERTPMFEKKAETTLVTRRLFDGDLLHEREYVFATRAFCTELAYPTIGR